MIEVEFVSQCLHRNIIAYTAVQIQLITVIVVDIKVTWMEPLKWASWKIVVS